MAIVLALVFAAAVSGFILLAPTPSRAAPVARIDVPPPHARIAQADVADEALHTSSLISISLTHGRIAQANVAAVDFNGNGYKELVVGGEDGNLYVIAYNGSQWSQVWRRQTAADLNAAGAPQASPCVTKTSDIRSSAAIGDLDGDGSLEIVVTTGGDPANHRNGGVLVYSYQSDQPWSFSLMPGWPQPKLDIVGKGPGASDPDGCWDGIWGSPALGDLNGDGKLEIAVEGFDRRLHVWRYDGTYLPGWPIQPPTIWRGGWSSPAIADLDNNGLPEVIFGTDNATNGRAPYHLYVYRWNGTLLPGFPVTTSQNMQSSPAIGDITGDGRLEIVIGTGTYESSGGHKVYAWDYQGRPVPGWPQSTDGNMPASPALGDITGDGKLEVVIGCGAEGDPFNPAPCSKMYAWRGNGQAVDGFPITVWSNVSWDEAIGLPNSPILADYDGDGQVEILAVVRWSWGISTLRRTGGVWQNVNDVNLRTCNVLYSSPLVDDIDGDGYLEIVIGGADANGGRGVVYIWGYSGTTAHARPWPMFHHNIARTGRHPWPPRLGFQSEVRLMHQEGSGDTATQRVAVWNRGEMDFDWSIGHAITRLQIAPVSGVVETITDTRFTVDTTGLSTGWHELGTLTVTGTGTLNGAPILDSPIVSTLYVYVGDIHRLQLPLVLRSH